MRIKLPKIDTPRTYTYQEFENLPDDGNRYELIDGRLIEMPPVGDEHGSICDKLYRSLVFFDPQPNFTMPVAKLFE
jgi:Uma2 family endonuclease